jgi:hypothetical protein
MSAADFRRILVMGCSRSGTTLLQSLLASHSRVHTFPETGVFLRAFGMRGRVLPWARLGISLGKERKALARLLSVQKEAQGALPWLPPRRLSLSRSLSDVAGFLDGLAAAHGKDAWVEKTPRHVLHCRRIQRAVPWAICIHMVRGGEDVVASIVDRAKRYPDRFPRQADPTYGIRQWNRSIRATAVALEGPGHAVVFYEDLVSEVEPTMRALCTILDLDFEPGVLTPADRASFTGPDEEWKSQVNGPVEKAQSKFEQLFDEGERVRISQSLDTGVYDALRARASEQAGGVLVSGSAKP